MAYARRAGAYALQGSPERDQAYVFSITTPEARARSIADLERAFRLGADNDAGPGHPGGQLLLRPALRRRRGPGPSGPGPQPPPDRGPVSPGLALAAQGRADPAAQSLDLFARQAAEATDGRQREELFAAGHTTLEQLARQGRGGPASPDSSTTSSPPLRPWPPATPCARPRPGRPSPTWPCPPVTGP